MSDISNISGIGPKKLEYFKKLNINSLSDALLHYPRAYQDRSVFYNTKNCIFDTKIPMVLLIASVSSRNIRKGMTITQIKACDDYGVCDITLFNQQFMSKNLKIGDPYLFFGIVTKSGSKIQMTSPTIEPFSEKTRKILPIYNLTAKLTQNDLRNVLYHALKTQEIHEILPPEICEKHQLPSLKNSLKAIHFPQNTSDIEIATKRIYFEQMFLYFAKIHYFKQFQNSSYSLGFYDFSAITDKLPYTLTDAQKNAISDCISDMKTGNQMNRIIQGDVGSGKTIVATILSYLVAQNDKQIAFMVPTEILATQHYNELQKIFADLPVNVALLTGSTTAKNKKIIKQNLNENQIQIIVGTHAIITDDTEFFDLGLVIVDEQHRFGVMQRAKLSAKGDNPHILVMSATPIPRTLSLVLYGDLDISFIDQMPQGRKPVETFVVDLSKRSRIFKFIKKHIDQKEQCYIVCPLVEYSEDVDAMDVTRYFDAVSKLFCDYNVGLMHGKMKSIEKDKIMSEFSQGKIDILVSTTVIEVGVNVQNATVMLIENAERFGLSALHQLRGRVGRGNAQSYCILMSAKDTARLEILANSNDGFEISKSDLEIRGAGDLFSGRQSGESSMQLFKSSLDFDLIKHSSDDAKQLILTNPTLSDFPNLKRQILTNFGQENLNIFN